MDNLRRIQLLRAANVAPGSVKLPVLLAVALDSEPGHADLAATAILKNGTAGEHEVPALLRIAAQPSLSEEMGAQLLACVGAKAVSGLAKALTVADAKTVRVAVLALGEIGTAAAPALSALRQLQAQHKHRAWMGLFGQDQVHTLATRAIERIESGQGPGELVEQARRSYSLKQKSLAASR